MSESAKQRIDKWLHCARVVKTRSMATKLTQAGRIRVNRNKITQAAFQVKAGDVVTATLDRRILVYRIIALGLCRGPYEEARQLYEDLTPSASLQNESVSKNQDPQRESGTGRPTKRERRQLDKARSRFT